MLRVAFVLRSTEVQPEFFWFVHTQTIQNNNDNNNSPTISNQNIAIKTTSFVPQVAMCPCTPLCGIIKPNNSFLLDRVVLWIGPQKKKRKNMWKDNGAVGAPNQKKTRRLQQIPFPYLNKLLNGVVLATPKNNSKTTPTASCHRTFISQVFSFSTHQQFPTKHSNKNHRLRTTEGPDPVFFIASNFVGSNKKHRVGAKVVTEKQ